jgi:hypothetical protein
MSTITQILDQIVDDCHSHDMHISHPVSEMHRQGTTPMFLIAGNYVLVL